MHTLLFDLPSKIVFYQVVLDAAANFQPCVIVQTFCRHLVSVVDNLTIRNRFQIVSTHVIVLSSRRFYLQIHFVQVLRVDAVLGCEGLIERKVRIEARVLAIIFVRIFRILLVIHVIIFRLV